MSRPPFGPHPLTLFLFVFSTRIRVCARARVRDLENVLVPGVHAAGALMAQHAKRILLYYY